MKLRPGKQEEADEDGTRPSARGSSSLSASSPSSDQQAAPADANALTQEDQKKAGKG